ncbi:hypothetical protein CG723_41375 [Streptomyces sp. CB01635]|nr:hypothetical protein CG723_41375 [Streptomyces sp. CB01635]
MPLLFIEADNCHEDAATIAAKFDKYMRFYQRTVKYTDGRERPMWHTRWSAPQVQRNVSPAMPPVLLVFHQIGARPARTQMQKVARLTREHWQGRWDSDGAFHTYEQKIPLVATTLELLREQGPHGKIFWRFNRRHLQTLWDAIGTPRLDAALERRREQAQAWHEAHQAEQKRLAAQQAAEHEARRPVCTVCGAKFPDDRWEIVQRYPRPSNEWRPHP